MATRVRTRSALSAEPYRAGALVALLRLQWFIRLRWAFVLAALGVLALERFTFPAVTRPWQLLAAIGGVALVNLVWTGASFLLRANFVEQPGRLPETAGAAARFANAQVAGDLLLLTVILRFSGGVENPMVFFYAFHIAIGALLLRKRHAVFQAIWAILLYAAMALGQLCDVLVPFYPLLPSLGSPQWFADPLFVIVAVIVQICGVGGVLYFTLHIAAALDERDEQLLAANTALQRSEQAIRNLQARRARFMQIAAHQLKSPLAVIQTLAVLIRDELVPAAAVRSTSEKIIRRCQEGVVQVAELLRLARVQESDPRRHRDAVTQLAPLVDDLCRRFAPVAIQKGLRLHCVNAGSDGLAACVDRQDADDCFSNLLENAVKYTPAPGAIHVRVGRRQANIAGLPGGVRPFVYLVVRDSGIGIEPAALDDMSAGGSIFDAFRRGNNAIAAGIPGTGLGLSIVREVVEQAGGRIGVHSRPGGGSTFLVMLPAAAASVFDAATLGGQISQNGSAPGAGAPA